MPITKKMLDDCFDTMKLSESIWERMQRIRSRMESTTRAYSDIPGVSSPHDKISDGVAELDGLLKQFNREAAQYAGFAAEVNEAIQTLEEPKLRNLMGLRYLDGLEWAEVAVKVGYSEDHCYRLHREALSTMGINLPDNNS